MSDIQLLQGDCLELMKEIPDGSVDAVIADPPYGISYRSNFRKNRFDKIKNDDLILCDFVSQSARVLKDDGAFYCFTRWDVYPEWYSIVNDVMPVKNCIVWYKKGGGLGDLKKGYIYNHEFIIYSPMHMHMFNSKRRSDVFEFKKVNPSEYVHPTQKPVELLEEIITMSTYEGGVVLDPFMGSGSTGVACMNTGRNFIGIELDPGYFEIAKDRIERSKAK